jgi:hypothetical protein
MLQRLQDVAVTLPPGDLGSSPVSRRHGALTDHSSVSTQYRLRVSFIAHSVVCIPCLIIIDVFLQQARRARRLRLERGTGTASPPAEEEQGNRSGRQSSVSRCFTYCAFMILLRPSHSNTAR